MAIKSIRNNLLRWLIVPMGLMLIVGAIGDYRIALQSATTAYDDELLNTALAVSSQLTNEKDKVGIDLPLVAERVLMLDRYDETFFAVRGPDNQLIAGVANLPPATVAPNWQGHLHYDGVFRGKPVRVTALYLPYRGAQIEIQAAQTVVKRERLARAILIGMLWPELLVAVSTLVLVWLGVGQGLQPLLQLRDNLSARSERDLDPIPEHSAPLEVRPVLRALNGFLARLHTTLDAQAHFVSNAAHQLRTPLAALQSQVEFGLRQQDPSTWRQTLEKIHAGTKRTVRVANQLLTLARAEPGVFPDDTFQVLDLATLIKDAASEWVARAIAADKDLGLELQSAQVRGDRVLLRELISNLVDNAINYTPPGSQITISTRTEGERSVLEVKDDGPGIPSTEQDRIFDRFYRIEGTKGEGCGLGLAIVREVADAHGAVITLTAHKRGHGACITIDFPPLVNVDPGRADTRRRRLAPSAGCQA